MSTKAEFAVLKTQAFRKWDADSTLSPTEIARQLGVCRRTVSMWKHNWLASVSTAPALEFVPGLTWEKIVEAAPDKVALAVFILDGFVAKLQDADNKLKTAKEETKSIMEDRIRVFALYNELLTKQISGGHFTLDQTKHQLIPKRYDNRVPEKEAL